jgi:hypothetical protein
MLSLEQITVQQQEYDSSRVLRTRRQILSCLPVLLNIPPAALLQVFGATDEDVEKLRIVSLYDMDIDTMESLMKSSAADADEQSSQQGGPDKSNS